MANPILPNEKSTRSLSEFEFIHDPSDKNSKLGIGSFASVKLAKEKKTGKQHAIKIISMEPKKCTSSDLHNIRTEISIHRKLEHPNIVRFHDYIQKDNNIYFILDYAENGNLYSYIHKRKSLQPEEIFRFFHQTCLAIHYLHQNDVLHRDLKPENLLLDKSKDVKLCDFGWATRRITEKRTTFCGTYEYMAPEIVHKKTYDYRVDIWSLGVLLYELIHREAPYKGRSLPEITKSLTKPQITFKETCPSGAKDLILKILKHNPNERISVAQILAHPWVQSQAIETEEDVVLIEDVKVSRAARPVHYQSMVEIDVKRNRENFKSEIIISSGDSELLSDVSGPTTRKHSNANLYSSLSNLNKEKEKEREKPKERVKERLRAKEKMTSTASTTFSSNEGQRKSPLELNCTLKNLDSTLTSSRGHIKSSSSSIANNILEKLENEDRKHSGHLLNKKKIFEAQATTPSLRSKVDNIIHQLSSQTTAHRNEHHNTSNSIYSMKASLRELHAETPSGHRGHQLSSDIRNLFSNHTSRNQPAYKIISSENKHLMNSAVNSSNMASFRSRGGENESSREIHTLHLMKNAFQKKLTLPKGEILAGLNSSHLYGKTLTSRSKVDTRGSDMFDFEGGHIKQYQHPHSGYETAKASLYNRSMNVLANADQNKYRVSESQDLTASIGKLYKNLDFRRKAGYKMSDEMSLQMSAVTERRHDNKENNLRKVCA